MASWLRQYKENGIEGLKPKPRGRRANMSPPKRPKIKPTKANHDKSHEELWQELEYLRAEVAYLKKLDALIQKKEAQEKKQESSQD